MSTTHEPSSSSSSAGGISSLPAAAAQAATHALDKALDAVGLSTTTTTLEDKTQEKNGGAKEEKQQDGAGAGEGKKEDDGEVRTVFDDAVDPNVKVRLLHSRVACVLYVCVCVVRGGDSCAVVIQVRTRVVGGKGRASRVHAVRFGDAPRGGGGEQGIGVTSNSLRKGKRSWCGSFVERGSNWPPTSFGWPYGRRISRKHTGTGRGGDVFGLFFQRARNERPRGGGGHSFWRPRMGLLTLAGSRAVWHAPKRQGEGATPLCVTTGIGRPGS